MKKRGQENRFYASYNDDFIESSNQNYKIPGGYRWLRLDIRSRFLSGLIYGVAIIFANVYCRLCLHISYKNGKVLRKAKKTGGFIYCNHTQPMGDVFTPALPALPNRIYTVVGPANLGISGIGKILPYLGALPIPDTVDGMRQFSEAMEYRLKQNRFVVIYPEAHVWEYYTGIRPFPQTSFKYPVKYNKPVYCMTSTYQYRGKGKKPRTTVYVDGPFYPDKSISTKEQTEKLHKAVYECMKMRSGNSNYEYIRYEAKKVAEE
ncbi:MAG: hypothetical protein IJV71_04580 [Lachnospiraceae bacterium]|nr:hypothetical protein [Lachnospiraceae bacterium]